MSEHKHGGRTRRTVAFLAAGALLAGGLAAASPATAAPPAKGKAEKSGRHIDDNKQTRWSKKQDALRAKALKMRLKGNPAAQGSVAKVGKGQYADLANEGKDRIFVVLAEFGNTRHTSYCDAGQTCAFPPDGTATTYEGPQHNQIPQPDRAKDNSTLWQADYSPAHYQDMYFNRMARYYERQSSGRYSVEGNVTAWVRVPFNEARYGRDYCGGIVCNNTWLLIRDAMAYWVQGQLDSGRTMEQIKAELQTFDKQDRYDADGDGNFDEPDGFIDHFQIVHSGGDQAAGDPTYGSDAIWSHRWYAAVAGGGPNGFPGVNAGQGGTSSGQTIPSNPTGVWVGDYTIQPENGGLGVFAHEFGHDLGLPDLYDTSGNTGGAENSTGFWTLMSSGANIGDGGPDGIGDNPTDLGAWEKFQLGWLGCPSCPGGAFYRVASAGQNATFQLGPNDAATKKAQALFVVLPDKKRIDHIADPKTGSKMFYSSQGNDLNTTMAKTTGISGGTLTADVLYDVEEAFDFAFVEASADGGSTFTPVVTNLSSPASEDQSGLNSSGAGIDGSSGGAYVSLTATLPAGTNAVRFRYATDPGLVKLGMVADNIAIDGAAIGTAETDEGWTFDGWRITTGTEESFHFNAYVADNRQYDGYDTSLKTAYNFGFLDSRPDWVESYPYQNGLLINYWDESFSDNNVGDHPGGGLILPVDSHPTAEHWSDGQLMRQRIQSYDSTFGLEKTDAITLHKDSVATMVRSKAAVAAFDDLRAWWFAGDGHTAASHGRYQVGWTGVNVPKTGTTIRVQDVASGGKYMTVALSPSS